jgi:psp operon transcriptional activator
VVEYGAFERVGGSATVQVDVRLIGATNVDLPSEAAAGRFRHDLLDRLAFDVLTVPPLRARREDIPLLAEHFGRRSARSGWRACRLRRATRLARCWRTLAGQRARTEERGGAGGLSRRAPGRRITGCGSTRSPRRSARRRALRAGSHRCIAGIRDDGAAGRRRLDFRQTVAAFERRLLEDALARHRHIGGRPPAHSASPTISCATSRAGTACCRHG